MDLVFNRLWLLIYMMYLFFKIWGFIGLRIVCKFVVRYNLYIDVEFDLIMDWVY